MSDITIGLNRSSGSLPKDENLPDRLQDKMLEAVPSVEDDLVLVHASVDGFDASGKRRMIEKAFYVEPLEINGKHLAGDSNDDRRAALRIGDDAFRRKPKGRHSAKPD